jgi:ParB/RepB/Spo0J family partition protein
MSQLSILAVQNAPLLRALAIDPQTAKAELATAIGKDRSNLNRSIAALAEAGLLIGADDGERGLTDLGREQLAAIERAEGGEGKPGSSEGLPADHVIVVHAQLMPDPDNARKDWDSAEAVADLAELAESIDASGLLQNPMVKVASDDFQLPGQPTTYMLDGGERRFRAIARLIADGRWPADRPIICRLIETDDLGHRLAALAENMQRRNLNPLEKAKAFEGLAEALAAQGVAADKINREIADRVGVTIEHVQQHRSFLKLSEEDQARLALPKDDAKRLSVRDARQKLTDLAKKEAERAALMEVPIAERLALAETLHAIAARGKYSWDSIIIPADASETDLGKALTERSWLRFEGLQTWGAEKIGHHVVSRGHSVPWDIGQPFWQADEAERDEALRKAQAEAGYTDQTDYVTPWLNGPVERSEEGQALLDKAAAERAEREAATEAAEKEREAKQAEMAAARELQKVVATRSRDLFAAHRTSQPPAAEVTAIADEAKAPLPWRMNHTGDVVAADGTTVIGGRTDDQAEARMRLLILSINAVAGLETPEDLPDPNPTLDEDAFTVAMMAALERHGSDLSASPILTAFLTDNGVEYGEDGWDWTAEGAERLVVEAMATTDDDDAGEDADDDGEQDEAA